MAANDRIEINSGDIGYQQQAQAGRTEFYPGKAVSRAGDMNWEKDLRIPTATPAFNGEAAGPVEMGRNRITKLGRGIVCDQTLPIPVVLGVRVETRTEVGVSGANTSIDTETPTRRPEAERNAGNDHIVGA